VGGGAVGWQKAMVVVASLKGSVPPFTQKSVPFFAKNHLAPQCLPVAVDGVMGHQRRWKCNQPVKMFPWDPPRPSARKIGEGVERPLLCNVVATGASPGRMLAPSGPPLSRLGRLLRGILAMATSGTILEANQTRLPSS